MRNGLETKLFEGKWPAGDPPVPRRTEGALSVRADGADRSGHERPTRTGGRLRLGADVAIDRGFGFADAAETRGEGPSPRSSCLSGAQRRSRNSFRASTKPLGEPKVLDATRA